MIICELEYLSKPTILMVVWVVSWSRWFVINRNGDFWLVYWHYWLVRIDRGYRNGCFLYIYRNYRCWCCNNFGSVMWCYWTIMTSTIRDSVGRFTTDVFIISLMSIIRFQMARISISVTTVLIMSSVKFVAVLIIMTGILERTNRKKLLIRRIL